MDTPEAEPEGQQTSSTDHSVTETCSCSMLTADDIPGADLPKPVDQCKKSELQLWMKCRQLSYKSADNRATLISRVRGFLADGRTYKIVDPDPGMSYTRAKRAKCPTCSVAPDVVAITVDTDAPKEGWTKSAAVVPAMFSFLNITKHAQKTGKQAKSYVEKPLEKGYRFFFEGYIHDAFSVTKDQQCHVKAKSYRSQRKNDPPHKIAVVLSLSTGDVISGKCSCVAGTSGYCNHVMGLLYLIDHTKKLKLTDFPQSGTCTENPQQWHKPRGKGIAPEPVMCRSVIRPVYDAKQPVGIRPSLYDARGPEARSHDMGSLVSLMRTIDPTLGISNLSPPVHEPVRTLMGFSVPQGSALSYQLAVTEGHFPVSCDLSAVTPNDAVRVPEKFQVLPVRQVPVVSIDTDDPKVSQMMANVALDHEKSAQLERETVGQNNNPKWFQARKNRLTCSNFGLILQRKTVSTKFIEATLIGTNKDLSHVPAIKYGLQNEKLACEKYAAYMTNIGEKVTVESAGCVVNPSFPWLAGSPDGKVISVKAGLGLLEIKCSYSNRQITPKAACQVPNFFCQFVGDSVKLKRSHNYYKQVQGQLGVCGLDWCDFVVYTDRGLSIERIPFDEEFFTEMMHKLTNFYVKHFAPACKCD